MTVNTTDSRTGLLAGNGVTVSFPYAFKVNQASDLQVYIVDNATQVGTLVPTAQYTVSLNTNLVGGSVVFITAPFAYQSVSIIRVMEVKQSTDLTNQGAFFPEIHESVFDKLVMLIQQVGTAVGRQLTKSFSGGDSYDAVGSRITGVGTAINPTDVPNLQQMQAAIIAGAAPALALPVGSSFVGYQQAGTGAVARLVQDELRDTVKVEQFGAVGDGVTDDTAAIQRAVNYVQSNGGGVVRFRRNRNYKITATITNDRLADSTRERVSFVGDDETTTFITSTVGTAFSIRNAVTGGTGEPNVSNQVVAHLTILGPAKATNSAGLLLELVSCIHLEHLRIQGFDYAIYATDMDQCTLNRCELRFNHHGIFARKNPVPNAASTQPNNWLLTQCGIGSNDQYGAQWVGGSTVTMVGGIIANNGSSFGPGLTGFGVAFTDCGYEGGVGPNFFGTYFEANNGVADVVLSSLTTQGTPITQCVYNFYGCSFNRISNTFYSINSIQTNFGTVPNVGIQKLNVHGCSFKSLGAYTPNAARPYIAFIGLAAYKDNFYESANLYEDAVELPAIAGQGNMTSQKVSRTVNSPITNATETQIPLDTANQGFSWAAGFSGNGLVIPETGVYTYTAQQCFTTNTAGYKRLSVLKAGVVISSGSIASADSQVAASGVDYFTAGQIVTLSIRQETGGAMTVAGSGVANSYLMMKRIG